MHVKVNAISDGGSAMIEAASIRWLHGSSEPGSSPRRPASTCPAPGAIVALVQERLAELLPRPADPRDAIASAMHGLVLAPAKRLRSILLVMSASELGQDHPCVIDLACAVELVHGASLILDDLPCMDDAQLRRGQPTVHRVHGEDAAILASIALLSRALQLTAEVEGVSPQQRAALVAVLATSIGNQGLACGQLRDLRGTLEQSPEDVALTNELKTGALFGAAMEMSAIAAGADEVTQRQLRNAALQLGHAFQLLDDLKDNLDSAISGKDGGQDAGKGTLVELLGPAEVRQRLAGHVEAACELLGGAYGPDSRLRTYVLHLFGGM